MYSHFIIPAINCGLLIVVLVTVWKMFRVQPPRSEPVCLRTGLNQCIALSDPSLLCPACQERLKARVAEVRHGDG